MLYVSLALFISGILALLLGVYQIGGIRFEAGRTALFVFLGLAITTLIGAVIRWSRTDRPN